MRAALPIEPFDPLGHGLDLDDDHGVIIFAAGIDVSGTPDNDVLTGTADDDTIEGLDGYDTLFGLAGDDTLDGGAGDDTLVGGAGADHLIGGGYDVFGLEGPSDGDYASYANATAGVTANMADPSGNTGDAAGDTYDAIKNLIGSAFDDVLTGDAPNSSIAGGDGADTIYAGAQDYIDGGDGDDHLVVDGTSPWIVDGGEGDDTALISGDATFVGVNVEHYEVSAGAVCTITVSNDGEIVLLGAADVTGGDFDDTIIGSAGDDTIDGGFGNDSISGGDGDDVLVSSGSQDRLDGGAGIDTLSFADIAFDAEVDLNLHLILNDGTGGGSNETVTGVENLIGGANPDALRGDNGANYIAAGGGGDTLLGRDGADTLDGGAGNDTMAGGNGDDVYYVGSVGDRVTESSGAGTGVDLVISTISLTLSNNVENLQLATGALNGVGNGSANAITGNESANSLTGAAGDDTLAGGGGADTLNGGADNDTYLVDAAGVSIVEASGQGIDTVISSVSMTLAAEVENLVLVGTVGLSGAGNGGDNHITGSDGDDTLTGGAGSDTLEGGQGDDTYVAQTSGVSAVEAADEGVDTVETDVSFTLGANIENLVLTTTESSTLVGNALDNHITGDAGDDHLVDGGGVDTLTGGGGDDNYLITDSRAVIVENDGEGYDAVRTLVSFTLADNLEQLMLKGSDAIDGTGNGLDNRIVGNGQANAIDGSGGDDLLRGGAGDDTLTGGAGVDRLKGDSGADSFVFGAPSDSPAAYDRILDFEEGTDRIDLSGFDDGDGALHLSAANHLTGEAGQVVVRVGANATTVQVDLDGDGTADFMLVLRGEHALQASDFVF